MFKPKKYCNLCNIQIGKMDKTFCRDCNKIRMYIRENGMNVMLQFIQQSPLSYPPPYAP